MAQFGIWGGGNHQPVLARWTSDWDCGYETSWWYVIKDGTFDISALSSSTKKHIRQALKKVRVECVDPLTISKELYNCYVEAFSRYKNTTTKISSYEEFYQGLYNDLENAKYYVAFEKEINRVIGYMRCVEYQEYVEIKTAKYSAEYMNLRASDALHYTVLDYYLNQKKCKYISSGSRNISHNTNAQDYKIDTFGFRKAYCKLHVVYRKPIGLIVKILFPVRNQLKKIKSINMFHLINSVLDMEAYVRSCN